MCLRLRSAAWADGVVAILVEYLAAHEVLGILVQVCDAEAVMEGRACMVRVPIKEESVGSPCLPTPALGT